MSNIDPRLLREERERIDGLLAMLNEDCPHTLERTDATALRELWYDEEEDLGFWALTALTVQVREPKSVWPYTLGPAQERTGCVLVWRTDVDGVRWRCTLLSREGVVLSSWEGYAGG